MDSEDYRDLEAEFAAAIAAAKVDPTAVDVRQVWRTVERFLEKGSEWEQLQAVGSAIVQLAEIYHSKAEQLLTDWEEQHSPLGPPMHEDLLGGLVQRTMYLDVSELVKQPRRRSKGKKQPELPDHASIAQVVAKEKVLAFLDAHDEAEAKAQALAVAHDEDVSQWISAIEDWMQQQAQEWIPFLKLQQGVGLSIIKVWLALLLGGFELRQQDRFYDGTSIVVRYNTQRS